jgi:hypothetical protein
MECFVCHTPMNQLSHPSFAILSYACESCGLRYQDQGMRGDEERTRYALHKNEPTSAYVAMFESILTTIEPFISGSVLDFGSGEFNVLEQLLNQRFMITSYDLFFHPIPLSTYDTVIAIEVVEHFIDPAREWKQLLSLVNPGGHLIVQTRFVETPFFEWWYQRDPTHRTFYTLVALSYLATQAGFQVTFSNNRSIIVMKRGR